MCGPHPGISGLKCRPVSDLLEAAAAALNTPPELVRRSAAARAEATGTSVDEVLSAWAGGAPITAAAPAAPETPQEEPPVEPATVATAPVAVMEAPTPESPPTGAPQWEPEPAEALEPVPLGSRVRTAVRVGTWTGAALGFFGFLAAAALWAPTAIISPEDGPMVVVETRTILTGLTLVSVLFGAIVASFSRAAAAWANPATQLSNSKSSTAWWGAATGLILGLIGGAVLVGALGTPIEATEEAAATTQLPVLGTLVLMIVGGGLAGALTAALPQILGTPVALGGEDPGEVASMKQRLKGAVSIPVAGLMLLLLLVLPFAYALIRSAELSPIGAPIVAILTAAGILGFATLAGSRPQMKISLGELMVAVLAIGTVLLIILAALFYAGGGGEDEGSEGGAETVVVVAQL